MTTAIKRLTVGDTPPPNDPSKKDDLRFRYSFTAENQSHSVELIDYSGELVQIQVAHEEPAHMLRRVLEKMDGLLVLVPLVNSHAEEERLAEEVHDLQRAFAGLAAGIEKAEEGPLNKPLAMLVNKWDRHGRLADAETARNQLRAFLEGSLTAESAKPPMHRGMADRMRNSVHSGDFEEFPVSAFGESGLARLDDGREIERPRQINPLASFGLLEPFLWLVRRRNEIDLRLFLDKTQKYQWVGWLPAPFSSGMTELVSEGRSIARVLPNGTPEQQHAHHALRRLDHRIVGRRFLGVALLILIYLTGEWAWDIVGYKRADATLADSKSSQPVVDSATDWYRSYRRTGPWRHLVLKSTVLGPLKAEEELRRFLERQEDRLWKQVDEAGSDVLNQLPHANEYLKRFPNGRHKADASAIIEKAKIAVERRENDLTLQLLKAKLAAEMLRPSEIINDLGPLENLHGELSALPKYPNSETEAQAADRRGLMAAVVRKIDEVAAAKDWLQFEKSYETYMADKNVIAAAGILKKRLADQRIAKLKADFLGRSQKALQQRIEGLAIPKTDVAWEEADSLLEDFMRIDAALQRQDSAKYAQVLRSWINEQQDTHLYEQVRARRDQESVERYLTKAPLKGMREAVTKYGQYLEESRGARDLDLTLVLTEVRWGQNARDETNNNVMVRFGKVGQPDKLVFDVKDVSSKSRQPQTLSEKPHPFRAKLTDRCSMSVEIISRNRILADNPQGKGPDEHLVRDMQNFCVALHEPDNWVWFHVEGLPHEPELKDWTP